VEEATTGVTTAGSVFLTPFLITPAVRSVTIYRKPWQTLEQVCAQWISRESLSGRGWYDVHARRPSSRA
jgi:hypothetical protein